MRIDRLSKEALLKILKGDLKVDADCVIKFYSNDCHLCHAFKDYYVNITEDEEFSDIHFFAFNIADYPAAEKRLGFYGVPSIVFLGVKASSPNPKIRVAKDPEKPNEETWYTVNHIKQFIRQEME
mgnify:FL=1|jgi:thiol-disulfide isomerase/thioredoxin